MEKRNFTKAMLVGLEPRGERYEVADTQIGGLRVRVTPLGAKTFTVVKKVKGRPVRVTLGKYPDLTPEMARKKAAKVIGEMAYHEVDPNQRKRAERQQLITLGEAFAAYLVDIPLSENTIKAYRLAISRDLSGWVDKSLTSITGAMVEKRHRELMQQSPTGANRAMRVLRAVWNHTRDQSDDENGQPILPECPVRKINRKWAREVRRQSYIAPGQLSDWWAATEAIADPGEYKRGDGELARDYLQFVLLTGLRRREASGLCWSNIDIKGRAFTVTDTKNHRPLKLPLSDYLVDMLVRRKKNAGDEYGPFPLEEPKRFVSWVRDRSGVNFTVHDLRRTFITLAEGLDISLLAIKALVNHQSGTGDVTAGYAQIGTERLRKPMQQIADTVLAYACEKPSGGIVPMAGYKKLDGSHG